MHGGVACQVVFQVFEKSPKYRQNQQSAAAKPVKRRAFIAFFSPSEALCAAPEVTGVPTAAEVGALLKLLMAAWNNPRPF